AVAAVVPLGPRFVDCRLAGGSRQACLRRRKAHELPSTRAKPRWYCRRGPPKSWTAWTRRLRQPKQHYQKALEVSSYPLLQLDALEGRLAERADPSRWERPLEAMAYRRFKLNRRKSAIELVLKLLNGLTLRGNSAPEGIRPPREIDTRY